MKKVVYVSSTVKDLRPHRRAVRDQLSDYGYDVDAMEKYAALDDRPKTACEKQAAACDFYVGIFAWRYGFTPQEDNPDGRSITELEYLAAEKKPRLIFLLADRASWPDSLRDSKRAKDGGKRIRALRTRLKNERWTGFFRSPAGLAADVLKAIHQEEATKRVEIMSVEMLKSAKDFGTSYLESIRTQLEQHKSSEFVALQLGPIPWWNTRLHLVAALASDFTDIQHMVLLDDRGGFLQMVSPVELRRGLSKAEPKLERAYLESREMAPDELKGDIERSLHRYKEAVAKVFGRPEDEAKRDVKRIGLAELGLRQDCEKLVHEEGRPSLNDDILRRSSRYVVVMRDDHVEGVVDRLELASRAAKLAQ